MDNGGLLKLASLGSVLVAVTLIVVKLAAWLLTGSVSLLASLVDSIMDSLASLINLLAIRYSLQPADEHHRFGHGKAEPLAGLAQAAFISGSAVFLIFHAVDRLRYPRELEAVAVGIGVMVFAILLTLGLLVLQHFVIRRTGSTAIRADALHYASDVLTNSSILLALYLSSLGVSWADPVFAIGIALYIFYSAFRIGHESFQHLMDRQLPKEVLDQILSAANAHQSVLGVHDLRTRQSGQMNFVQAHVELDQDLSLEQAHTVGDEVEEKIKSILPGAEVIIHLDPVNNEGERPSMRKPAQN
ncbi:MAG: cation diffusion facilitator family transporter [Xanthomonadales bacterium]|nr:cation diffusion facilitator family transporter [Gammaproteobacteria bacterium]MBT8053107.1 cation diffusion facilitator family transporter [Gammaproteobacteria bacterium]NND56241.1 cation diffusion facilitator family transporter [Xanthomonadales bacterium]NNK52316.1 cation diffusion facilitator family transporter [Xanthomonadales bacterium]